MNWRKQQKRFASISQPKCKFSIEPFSNQKINFKVLELYITIEDLIAPLVLWPIRNPVITIKMRRWSYSEYIENPTAKISFN
ncbi:hypothetical protein [Algoriphagus ratkowskyi]|uniref:Uncharacterized protein n=1 Tax=Algoriphagus ratkowskyi TaxID=57028 RepID=A0ABY3HMB9_9BACT|nr:hypothetical protein [Algoriphagus ratkowskyi]TXD77427.1 hypothetical protein ESW18_11525 [Algoriphagus ratkowskyi]